MAIFPNDPSPMHDGYRHLRLDGTPCAYPPGKVVCVGRNYAAHIAELGNATPAEPVLFMKPSTALTPFARPLNLPEESGSCHYEAELALLVHAPLTRVSAREARAGAGGIGLALDLTLREVQARLKTKGLPWERAKAWDGSCPITPWVSMERIGDPDALRFALTINGDLRQQGNPRLMLWPMFDLVAHISARFTLLPGDVILTGTPAGVGPLHPGDRLALTLTRDTGSLLQLETRVAKSR